MMIGSTLSHYEITAELGRGGMGIVYRALDQELKRPVALKVMSAMELASEQARARFRQEAQAAAKLSHPNVATIYQIGEDQGKLFIAMELVEGQTLEALIASGVSTKQALLIGAQLAEGIAAAHAQGIVHRDIKPANVMVSANGRVKVLDFGLAKTEASANLTAEGSTVGTIAYMSPEQVRGENVGTPSDMWSLGVLLFEMLSGKRPFSAAYDAALSFQILNEAAPDLDDSIPEDIRSGVHALLSKEPKERPKDVQSLLAEYAPSGITTSFSRPVAVVKPSFSSKIPVLGALIVLLVAVGAWLFWPSAVLESEEQDGIAVFPFLVVGSNGSDSFGDGFARLLTDRLDESGAVRTVEYNGLRGHVDEAGGSVRSPEDARGLAAAFHAEGFVFGDVVKVPGSIVVSASMYSADGTEMANAEVAIEQEAELLHAVNELGRLLLASRYGESGNVANQAGALSTESFPALRAYLAGMEYQRATKFESAYAEFEKATSLDSTFAMAWYGMGRMSGWYANPRDPEGKLYDKALAYPDRIPKRFKDRIEAGMAVKRGQIETAFALYEQATKDYPDDADAWALRGDVHYHYNRWMGRPISEAVEFMERAQELDPGNAEMSQHLLIAKADENPGLNYAAYVDRFRSLGRTAFNPEWIPQLLGDADQIDQALLDSLAKSDDWFWPINLWMFYSEEPFKAESYVTRFDDGRRAIQSGILLSTGRARESWELVEELGRNAGSVGPGQYAITLMPSMAIPPPDVLDRLWDRDVLPAWGEQVEADAKARRTFFYHVGALAIMRGNDSDAQKAVSALRTDTTREARGLESMLDARRNLLARNFAAANEAADEAFRRIPLIDNYGTVGGIWPYQARLLKLEALAGLGRHEEVIHWIDVLGDGNSRLEDNSEGFLMQPWWAPMAFMKGKAHMGIGQLDEAEVSFTRFLDLFQKAEEPYQHLVDDARAELDRIAEWRTREPVS